MKCDHELASDTPPLISVSGGVDADTLPEDQQVVADSSQMTWSCL